MDEVARVTGEVGHSTSVLDVFRILNDTYQVREGTSRRERERARKSARERARKRVSQREEERERRRGTQEERETQVRRIRRKERKTHEVKKEAIRRLERW